MAAPDAEVISEKEVEEVPTVLVTGFGPFGVHSVNASWEVVKLLSESKLEEELGVKLEIRQVPVSYKSVQEIVPQLWDTLRPALVVHVGVSSLAQALTLEQQAYNAGYESPDIVQSIPPDGRCLIDADSPDILVSAIDMGIVGQQVDCTDCGVISCVSRDPGRYLCEFIYYRSLAINKERAAFVHVPCLDGPYSASQLASGLKEAVKAMFMQIKRSTSQGS